jgi:hypothetical protein
MNFPRRSAKAPTANVRLRMDEPPADRLRATGRIGDAAGVCAMRSFGHGQTEKPASRQERAITGLRLGAGLGLGVCLAIVFHDGRGSGEGAAVGAGFFVFGFVMGYSPIARAIGEALAILR